MKSMLIIQPWFSANGHPAQSLINTARVLANENHVSYLVSSITRSDRDKKNFQLLQGIAKVDKFVVNSSSLREGTFKSIFAVRKYCQKNLTIEKLFYFDAHLVLLALIWPFLRPRNIKRLYVCYLMGPERISRYRLINFIIARLLHRRDIVLLLRTQELVHDWQRLFPVASIRYLPSLEIFGITTDHLQPERKVRPHQTRFGVLGQVRIGKGLGWLVPLFQSHPDLGNLTICGTFSDKAAESKLAMLKHFSGFTNTFLSEQALLALAAKQDYLLMLYDDWDSRMEGAVMFLATKVNKPVIVYDKGWCGRMVRTYGNGLIAPAAKSNIIAFFKGLPVPDSDEYQKLLFGVTAFKRAHSGEQLKHAFLEALRD